MPKRVEVELDIFSGMPNPTWNLTDAQAAAFVQRLEATPKGPAVTLSGRLGYRGFVVQVMIDGQTQVVRVQNGFVQTSIGTTDAFARDVGRALERWLLDTGKPHLKNELFEIARRELP